MDSNRNGNGVGLDYLRYATRRLTLVSRDIRGLVFPSGKGGKQYTTGDRLFIVRVYKLSQD